MVAVALHSALQGVEVWRVGVDRVGHVAVVTKIRGI